MKPVYRHLCLVVFALTVVSLALFAGTSPTRCDAGEHEASGESSTEFPREELLQAFSSLQVSVIDPPQQMHDFVLETVQGQTIDTAQLRGKFLWLSFWKSECIYCRIETPTKEDLWGEFGGENFVLLAVNRMESRKTVEEFVEDFEVTFPVLLDPAGTVNGLYRVMWTPTNVFIDPEGNMVGTAMGSRYWDNPFFLTFLRILKNAGGEKG